MIKRFLNWIERVFKRIFGAKHEPTHPVLVEPCEQSDRWKIWVTHYDDYGNVEGYSVYHRDYAHKSSAVRRARKLWGNYPMVKWEVSQTNPWAVDEADYVHNDG